MGISQNIIDRSDISTYPIKTLYTASYPSSSFSNYGITINKGINSPYSISGSYSLNYKLAKQLYYNQYLTGSLLMSSSAWNDTLQSTAASGTFDNDYRYFPTKSEAVINIFAIPTNIFGENIQISSFSLTSSTYNIIDDKNGNLIDLSRNNDHVGNILYSQGIVIITNQNYIFTTDPDFIIQYYTRVVLENRYITKGGTDIGNYYDDGVTNNISIGFNFTFYDTIYNSVNLSSNGNLQFNSSNSTFSVYNIPEQSLSASIMPLLGDLYLARDARSDSGIYVQTIGTAPNRVFCAEWRGVQYSDRSNNVNFQIKLYETSNNIELLYGQIDKSFHNSVGIQRNGIKPYYDQFFIGTGIPLPKNSSVLYYTSLSTENLIQSNIILTEFGDLIITELGDYLVLESIDDTLLLTEALDIITTEKNNPLII
jgi:hypothetical protein